MVEPGLHVGIRDGGITAVDDTRRIKHLLDVDDLTREELDMFFSTADAMKEVLSREVKKVPTLRGRTVVTLFYEPSTRTRVSFEIAAKVLSADTINVASNTSSVIKGESFVDTIRTISAMGVDCIVLRHPMAGAPYLAAQHTQASIINAGDGWHAHPTQALLDAYTIREKIGRLDRIKVAIVGDILHSRVARSNIWALSSMGARVVLCGPPTLLPGAWNVSANDGESGVSIPGFPANVEIEEDINRALDDADAVMALRLQKERQDAGLLPSLRDYIRYYQITPERLARAKPYAIVMHPGPVNEGIEISPLLTRGSESVIEEQVSNGTAIRMAVLYLLLGGGH